MDTSKQSRGVFEEQIDPTMTAHPVQDQLGDLADQPVQTAFESLPGILDTDQSNTILALTGRIEVDTASHQPHMSFRSTYSTQPSPVQLESTMNSGTLGPSVSSLNSRSGMNPRVHTNAQDGEENFTHTSAEELEQNFSDLRALNYNFNTSYSNVLDPQENAGGQSS